MKSYGKHKQVDASFGSRTEGGRWLGGRRDILIWNGEEQFLAWRLQYYRHAALRDIHCAWDYFGEI